MAIINTADLERLQQQLRRFARVGLAQLPTPLEPLPRLTAHLGEPRVWVKREDCTGLGFGGNKLRKLDTCCAKPSTRVPIPWCRAGWCSRTASARWQPPRPSWVCLHLAVYHGRVEPPSPAYESSGNALLNRLFGATLHAVPWLGDRNQAIDRLADELRSRGRRPYVVPYGVSNALGAVGYVSALLEIATQCATLSFTPRAIVHCSGSGSTQAGLAVGAASVLPDTDVVGIDIDAEPERVATDVRKYAVAAAEMLDVAVRRGACRGGRGSRRSSLWPRSRSHH